MKKVVIGLLIIAGGLFLLRKTNVCSYVSTAWAKVKTGAKNQVPLEFEVDRVRHEIAGLEDDMRAHVGPIAEEMATIKDLRKRIDSTRDELKNQKRNILAMTRDLERGTETISYGDGDYSADEVRAKLDGDFASYRRCEAELKSQEKLLAAKQKSLRAVRGQLASMKSLKRDLEVQLAQLEADLKTVRLAQTRDKYQLDDSRLSDIKASLAEIEHRLNVERSVTELNGQVASDPISVHKKAKPVSDLTKEVKKYFGESTKERPERVASTRN
jgi:chromosome segregation ATPase